MVVGLEVGFRVGGLVGRRVGAFVGCLVGLGVGGVGTLVGRSVRGAMNIVLPNIGFVTHPKSVMSVGLLVVRQYIDQIVGLISDGLTGGRVGFIH